MTTPMMKQWHAAKENHPDGVLFFRMGDFYEFFHDDAKNAARLLGLTLTSRSKADGAIPMAGIPVKSADDYVRKLVAMGAKCVICEQIEDPADARGIVERQVTRVVTSGTITEDDSLDAKNNNFLVGVGPARDGFVLAWVDVSTGQFATRLTTERRLIDEIQAQEPAEILMPESWVAGSGPKSIEWKRVFECTITTRPDFCFDREDAVGRWNRHLGTRSLHGFGVDEETYPLGASGAVLEYLEETQRGAIGQIRGLRVVDGGHAMILDRTTRGSLELVARLADGGRKGSLLDTVDHTVTSMGARLFKSWLLAPLIDMAEIHRRQDAVSDLLDRPDALDDMRRELRDVLDMERLAARVGCQRATPRDLAGLRQSLRGLPALVAAIGESGSDLVASLVEGLPDLSDLSATLAAALVDEPPLQVKDGGIIREGYHVELDELRSIDREGKGFIASFQAREAEATGIANLKIGYNRVFGYYLEVTHSHRDKVPETYIRKQTLKNAERYITPELKEYEEKVLGAQERCGKIEYDLFCDLRGQVEARLDDLQETAQIVATLDVLQSMAHLAHEAAWCRPTITGDGTLNIEEGCHPVVVAQAGGEPFVPNDVELDSSSRLMLITGPNMAGKSTYIRQVALMTLLAQVGSWIPAKSATVGVVDRIFTRVGASDDIASGSSTFMVEMLEVANILNNASERSLVILDEVGRGTSTYDGLSIAWAITEHLARSVKSRTLFATHYHELCDITEDLPVVRNYNVAVREWGEEIVFLHKIVPGSTDKSYGIHVARLAGLPVDVIAQAKVILARLEERGDAVVVPSVGAPTSPTSPTSKASDAHDVSSDLSASSTPSSTVAAAADIPDEIQLGLFAPGVDPLRKRLRDIDVDNMTPMDALRLMAKLREEARE